MNDNVNGQGEISTVYESIVRALSEDYFDLYYVNVETGEYIEYGSITEAGKKSTEILDPRDSPGGPKLTPPSPFSRRLPKHLCRRSLQ